MQRCQTIIYSKMTRYWYLVHPHISDAKFQLASSNAMAFLNISALVWFLNFVILYFGCLICPLSISSYLISEDDIYI